MKRQAGPVRTEIVLVGGGHAHVYVMRSFARRPEPGVRLTLVAKELETPYSGMLPGAIAGLYRPDEIMIDLVRLARATNVRLIPAAAVGLDRAERRVRLEGRPPLAYDVVSFNVGIAPSLDAIAGVERAIAVKPIAAFLARFDAFLAAALQPGGPRHVAVAGAGAAGVELSLSIARRLRREAAACGIDPRAFSVTLLAGGGLLPTYPRKVQDLFFDALRQADVAFRDGAVLAGIEKGRAVLADGRTVPADAVFVATAAAPHPITGALGLPTDRAGFLAVEPTLASPGDPAVFAVGDCSGVIGQPRPKAGVFAVRQGPPLAANLRRAARGGALRPYVPQRDRLSLIGRGDGTAVAQRGPWVFEGRSGGRLKDLIDRRWMATHRDPAAIDGSRGSAPPSGDPAMRCGGSAATTGAARAFARLGPGVTAPAVTLGVGDDAAMVRRSDGGLDLLTVGLFKAFLDDPFLLGRIVAVHALGGVYARGGLPRRALAVATIPPALSRGQEETLYQLMAGARATLDPLGAAIVGGHSGEGAELAFGLSVTGEIEPGRAPLTKAGLKIGDVLILTKPLGTGIVVAAEMRAQAPAATWRAAIDAMLRPVAVDAKILDRFGACAATAVAGFGLVGHLVEMLDASGVAAELDPAALPVLPGVAELAARGFESTTPPQTFAADRVADRASLPRWLLALLFDPQTAGGLLAGVSAEKAESCVAALRVAGAAACVVGSVVEREGRPDVRLRRRVS